jgi:hypothetical protein
VVSGRCRMVFRHLSLRRVCPQPLAICSLIETAVSANNAWRFNEWLNQGGRTSGYKRWLRDHSTNALRHKCSVNALIVLINTILTVILSVATLGYVANPTSTSMVLGLNASNGFTIIGVSLAWISHSSRRSGLLCNSANPISYLWRMHGSEPEGRKTDCFLPVSDQLPVAR